MVLMAMSEKHEDRALRHRYGVGQNSAYLPRLLGAGARVDDGKRVGGGENVTVRGNAVGLRYDREDFHGQGAGDFLPNVGFDLHTRASPSTRYQALTSMNVVNPVRFKTFRICGGTCETVRRSPRFCSAFAASSKVRRPALLIYETFPRSSSTPPVGPSVARNNASCSSGAVLLSTAPTTWRTIVDGNCSRVISSSFISRLF